MTSRVFIGIDPGLTGAIAVIADGELFDVIDMPTVGRGKAGRQTVNSAALASHLRECLSSHPGASVQAVVEDVAARPKQGVSGVFRFGHSCGSVAGVLGAMRIPVDYVAPTRWKRAFGLLGADKDASRGKASDLYPGAPISLKKHHGRADAILLARWAYDQAMA